MKTIRIGLVGDYNETVTAHRAIPRAIALAATALGQIPVKVVWLNTAALAEQGWKQWPTMDGLWCMPGSPYASLTGALGAIRFARENRVPFLGTCGGFQHALLEYARHMVGLTGADHAETNPAATNPLINRLACPMVEQEGEILLQDNSRIQQIYGCAQAREKYHCRFGLNRNWEIHLSDAGLRFTGRDPQGEIRVVELPSHPFFIATLYQPERSALTGQVHPLIQAYLKSVLS